jgi:hypothetical protein
MEIVVKQKRMCNVSNRKWFLDSITVTPDVSNIAAIKEKFTYHWSTSALYNQNEFFSSG